MEAGGDEKLLIFFTSPNDKFTRMYLIMLEPGPFKIKQTLQRGLQSP